MRLHATVYALRLLGESGSQSNKMSPTWEVFGVCEEVRGGSMVFLLLSSREAGDSRSPHSIPGRAEAQRWPGTFLESQSFHGRTET